ncbi:hypothetical protein [Streptomyces mangrovisoli]|uniref:Uncharacterized protein n=1 Tax=Streptomyces mangrovisoli TaxID=1428628 RepID=A0A1J4P0Z3_9ACTN|nr:hypothetical protein [Streptomyces mangrovisoli]OIJ68272.1 hypothetical protein WN71_008805 [Streptomyces mangrovisoli]
MAQARGLTPLAALPGAEGRYVRLTGDEVSAADFIGLVGKCSARLLYFCTETFTAETFAVLDDDEFEAEDQLSADARDELNRLPPAHTTGGRGDLLHGRGPAPLLDRGSRLAAIPGPLA